LSESSEFKMSRLPTLVSTVGKFLSKQSAHENICPLQL